MIIIVIIICVPRILTIPTPIPSIPTVIPRIPALIPRVPILIPRVPIISLILFPDSPFWLLQVAQLYWLK